MATTILLTLVLLTIQLVKCADNDSPAAKQTNFKNSLMSKYVILLMLMFILFLVFGLMVAFVLRRRVIRYRERFLDSLSVEKRKEEAETDPESYSDCYSDSYSVQEIHVPELDLKSIGSTHTFEMPTAMENDSSDVKRVHDSRSLQSMETAVTSTANQTSSYNDNDSDAVDRSMDSSSTNIWNEDSLLQSSTFSSSSGSIPGADPPLPNRRMSKQSKPC